MLVTKALPQDVAFLAFVPSLRRHAYPPGVAPRTPAGVVLRLNAEILGIIYDNSIPYEEKVEAFFNSQKDNGYLQPGDVMRLEIKSEDGVIDLGVQENKIVQAVAVKKRGI